MITRVFSFSPIIVCFLVTGCAGFFKEIKKPIKTKEVSVIEKFGFKTRYHFKQTQIDLKEEVKKLGESPPRRLGDLTKKKEKFFKKKIIPLKISYFQSLSPYASPLFSSTHQ